MNNRKAKDHSETRHGGRVMDWPRIMRGAIALGTIQVTCILIRYFEVDIVSLSSSTRGIWALSIFPIPLLCVAILFDLLRDKLSKVNQE
jgi:hypothetical protein